jgi:hypothetical protein
MTSGNILDGRLRYELANQARYLSRGGLQSHGFMNGRYFVGITSKMNVSMDRNCCRTRLGLGHVYIWIVFRSGRGGRSVKSRKAD